MSGDVITQAELVAVWDVREPSWPQDREGKCDWAHEHGLLSSTYRIEFYRHDLTYRRLFFARLFCYHLDEAGRVHWTDAHKLHNEPHDHSACGVATEPPRDVPLAELPPRELLEAGREPNPLTGVPGGAVNRVADALPVVASPGLRSPVARPVSPASPKPPSPSDIGGECAGLSLIRSLEPGGMT